MLNQSSSGWIAAWLRRGAALCICTATSVSAALGVPVDEGANSLPGHTEFCVWRERGVSQAEAQNVQVKLLTDSQYQAAKAGPYAKGSESGVGNEAYWAYTPGIGFTLSVKTNSAYFRVQSRPIPRALSRKPDTPDEKAKWDDKTKAVERTVALEVLKKL
jgi:hypothetical protein